MLSLCLHHRIGWKTSTCHSAPSCTYVVNYGPPLRRETKMRRAIPTDMSVTLTLIFSNWCGLSHYQSLIWSVEGCVFCHQ